MVRSHYVVEGF